MQFIFQSIGPYKGGLAFYPSVNAAFIKVPRLEQIFKIIAHYTGLLLVELKARGSNFDSKRPNQTMILCVFASLFYLTELYRHNRRHLLTFPAV